MINVSSKAKNVYNKINNPNLSTSCIQNVQIHTFKLRDLCKVWHVLEAYEFKHVEAISNTLQNINYCHVHMCP